MSIDDGFEALAPVYLVRGSTFLPFTVTLKSRCGPVEDPVEPTLPIIDGEGKYHIVVDLDSEIPKGIFLRLDFLVKNGEEAGSFIVDQPEMDFQCPLKTYSYKAELICAGGHTFHFHSFTISERTG